MLWLTRRLRVVSLCHENPWERTENRYACGLDCNRDVGVVMPRAASSVASPRKRETSRTLAHTMLLFEEFAQFFDLWIETNFTYKLLVIKYKLVTNNCFYVSGSVAEWSKALVEGTSLFGGVGSSPTKFFFFFFFLLLSTQIFMDSSYQ